MGQPSVPERLPGRGAMSVPPDRLLIVPESVHSDRRVAGHDRYRAMRRAPRMSPAIDRM